MRETGILPIVTLLCTEYFKATEEPTDQSKYAVDEDMPT